MVTRIIFLNSCACRLAEIKLVDAHNVQFVGPNNAGKSSLVHALNFLFLPTKKQRFAADRSSDPDTRNYYFPVPEASYIVFESIARGRSFCLVAYGELVDSRVGWFKVEHVYERDHYLTAEPTLRPLKELFGELTSRTIEAEKIKKSEVLHREVFGSGHQSQALVRLQRSKHVSVTRFQALYEALLHTQTLTPARLKAMLLTADGRDESKLTYQANLLAQLEEAEREYAALQTLKKYRENYASLATEHETFLAQNESLVSSVAGLRRTAVFCRKAAKNTLDAITGEYEGKELERNRLHLKVEAALEGIGRLRSQLEFAKKDQYKIQSQVVEVTALDDLSFLEQAAHNAQRNLGQLRQRLALAQADGRTVPQLEQKHHELLTSAQTLTHEIETRQTWLVNRLADAEPVRAQLERLLQTKIARASDIPVQQKISELTTEVHLNGGSFTLPHDGQPASPRKTEKALAAELAELRKESDRIAQLLTSVRERETLEANVRDAELKHTAADAKLRRKRSLPDLTTQLAEAVRTVGELSQKRATLAEARQQTNAQLAQIQIQLTAIDQRSLRARAMDAAASLVLEYLPDDTPEDSPSPDREVSAPATADELRERLAAYKEQRAINELTQQDLARRCTQLAHDLSIDRANAAAILEECALRYGTSAGNEAAYDKTRGVLTAALALPAERLISDYRNLELFKNKFNLQLRRIKVSDIDELSIAFKTNQAILTELETIAALDRADDDLFSSAKKPTRGGREIVEERLRRQQELRLGDLFDLELILKRGDHTQRADLSKQVESDGTNKMLRLVLAMAVMSYVADLDAERPLPIFIDEVATLDATNREALVAFCRAQHFYPLFAAPEAVEGLDRYYFLSRTPGGRLRAMHQTNAVDAPR